MKPMLKLWQHPKLLALTIVAVLMFPTERGMTSSTASYSDKDLAVLLYNRIAGVPPDKATLDKMIELLKAGKKKEAAALATESADFYNVKLRNMFSAWSNTSGNIDVDLNDMVATMIGMVRDDVSFNEVLSGDYLYTADSSATYQANNNSLYFNLQSQDLQSVLIKKKQSEVFADIKHLPSEAQAGIISTRAFGEAYFSAGTNRRATAFTLKYFLCHDMEALHNTNISDRKVRPDVSRAPGGDASLFKNRCQGCHSGMDALSGWSVYYDFSQNKTVYQTGVQKKITRNFYEYEYDEKGKEISKELQEGHVPVDDSFENLWAAEPQEQLGWGSNTNGNGAKDYGNMLAASDAFAACMATHAYEQICLLTPDNTAEKTLRDTLAQEFKSDGYSMKKLFAATAAACLLGDD